MPKTYAFHPRFFFWIAILWSLTKQRTFYTNGQGSLRISPLNPGSTVPRFCSWQPDPDAEHFDAFSISWSQIDLVYIFPSFALIARCLQKMCAEMARGWLIVLMWPSQPWIGILLKMLINEPWLIMRKDVLRQLSAAEEHPIMKHTRLMACLLSSNS